MSPPRPPPIPSVTDLCPDVRRHARRAAVEVRRLVDALVGALPDAALLALDPGLAERINTTPHDHVAAHVIVTARSFLYAVDDLPDPP